MGQNPIDDSAPAMQFDLRILAHAPALWLDCFDVCMGESFASALAGFLLRVWLRIARS
jgi:hypothetical protein